MTLIEFKALSKQIETTIRKNEQLVKRKKLEQAADYRLQERALITKLYNTIPESGKTSGFL